MVIPNVVATAKQEQCSLASVRGVVADSLGLKLGDVDASSTFVSLGVDSLDFAQLLLDVEEGLQIEIPKEDEAKIFRVQDLVKYLDPISN